MRRAFFFKPLKKFFYMYLSVFKKKFFFNVFYLFLGQRETDTECEWVGAEREGDTESEAGSRL